MSSRVIDLMNKLKSLNKHRNITSDRKIAIFLVLIIGYSIFCRIIPPEVISIFVVMFFLAFVFFEFYLYVMAHAKIENKNHNTVEYSWGHVKQKTDTYDAKRFFEYIHAQDFNFYKTFLQMHTDKIILFSFIFIDLIIAFKNLSFFYSGTYFALSLFTKFVFVAYLQLEKIYNRIDHIKLPENENKDDVILDIFYSQFNGIVSVFFVVFVFFFILSKYITEIFFGASYSPVQSSLPFVLIANMFLTISLCIYETAKRIDRRATNNILKVYCPLFLVIFVFMSINYVDTVTYFIVGASSILSIFLYNFVIKKPQYIAETYNHMF